MTGLLRRFLPIADETTPIHVGHRYTDTITGERFDVVTVGTKTTIERLDADRRPRNSMKTSHFRSAVDAGVISHSPDKCPECETR